MKLPERFWAFKKLKKASSGCAGREKTSLDWLRVEKWLYCAGTEAASETAIAATATGLVSLKRRAGIVCADVAEEGDATAVRTKTEANDVNNTNLCILSQTATLLNEITNGKQKLVTKNATIKACSPLILILTNRGMKNSVK